MTAAIRRRTDGKLPMKSRLENGRARLLAHPTHTDSDRDPSVVLSAPSGSSPGGARERLSGMQGRFVTSSYFAQSSVRMCMIAALWLDATSTKSSEGERASPFGNTWVQRGMRVRG